jgi:hypothetical protein
LTPCIENRAVTCSLSRPTERCFGAGARAEVSSAVVKPMPACTSPSCSAVSPKVAAQLEAAKPVMAIPRLIGSAAIARTTTVPRFTRTCFHCDFGISRSSSATTACAIVDSVTPPRSAADTTTSSTVGRPGNS